MKIRLPERVAGVREAMFVVEAEFPVSSSRRRVEVKTTGSIQAMDVRGEGPGGTYELPVGGERLHVPIRVTHGGAGDATVEVGCIEGPEAGQSEARTILLDPSMVVGAGQPVASSSGGSKWPAVLLLTAAVAGGGYLAKDKITSFFGGGGLQVPQIQGWSQSTAEKTLEDKGYVARIVHKQVEDSAKDGRVLAVAPVPGSELASGETVTVTIGVPKSKGTPVPVLSGMTEAIAQATLDDLGLQANIEYVPVDDEAREGLVLSQAPAKGALITRGETVTLRVGGESTSIADATPPLPDPSTPSDPSASRPVVADADPNATAAGDPNLTDPAATQPDVSDPATSSITHTDPMASKPDDNGETDPTSATDPADRDPTTTTSNPSIEAHTTDSQDPTTSATQPTGATDTVEDAPANDDPKQPATTNDTTGSNTTETSDGETETTGTSSDDPEGVSSGDETAEDRNPEPTASPDEDAPLDDGMVAIPVVVGKPLADARAAIDKLGLFITVENRLVTKPELVGVVLQSIPAAMDRVSPAGLVQLTVGVAAPKDDTPTTTENPNSNDKPADTPKDPGATEPVPDQPNGNDPGANDPAGDEPATSTGSQPSDRDPPEAATTEVPDVVAMDRERAEALIRRAKLYYDLEFEDTENLPAGQVISQDPPAGSTLDTGKVVRLTIARLPRSFAGTLPDVLGLERNEAETRLRRRKVQVRVTYGGGTPSQAGMVLDMAPAAGEKVNEGEWVELVVATGKGGEIPKAIGGPSPWSKPEAPEVEKAERRPPGQPRGLLIEPPPMKRGAAPAKRVKLPSRDSEPTAKVPNVSGQSVYAAIERALASGLLPIVTPKPTGEAKIGHVIEQGTEADKMVHLGDLLKLSVYQPKPSAMQRSINVPSTVGGSAFRAHRRLQQQGINVRIVEVEIPNHPYAGTRRVAAQYPVSAVAALGAPQVTLWVIK